MNIAELEKQFSKFEAEAYSQTGEDVLFGYLYYNDEDGYYILGYDKHGSICGIYLSSLLDNSIRDNIINYWEKEKENLECGIAQCMDHESRRLNRLEKQQAIIQARIDEV
jgi:hypothetical protein